MRDEHVTIVDVARRAGLSVATVSRVMHDSPRVSQAARQRVQEAVATLGYTPNALARGLAMRSTHAIGAVVSSIADPFWGEVLRGIEDFAQEEHYAVLIASSYDNAERERRAVDLFRHRRVDGIIVGASSGGPDALLGSLARRLPVVLINTEQIEPEDEGRPPDANGYDAWQEGTAPTYMVANDDTHGAILVTEHLLALGHRRIAYIGTTTKGSSLRRLRGYRLALERAGLPRDESLVVTIGEGANYGELGAFRLLAPGPNPSPTALFCYDDMTALGALRAIHALNLRVPRDVSVAGFDDIPMAAYLDPPLTTVRLPMYEMGQQATRMLLDLLRGDEPPPVVTTPGELVVRESTGPPAT